MVEHGSRQVGSQLILRNRNFRCLWLGQVISQLGDKVFAMALVWWLLMLTTSEQYPAGRADMANYLMVAATLPAALFGPLAGSLVDCYPRQRLMVVADLGRFTVVLCLVALAVCGARSLLPVFALTFSLSLFSIVFNPSIQAVIPSLVSKDQLVEAIAWQQMTRDIANIFGAAFGGVLIAVIGVNLAFGFNALSFLVSALMISLIAAPGVHAGSKMTSSQILEGFTFIRHNRGLLLLLAGFAGLNLFVVPVFVLIPSYAKGALHGDAITFGALEACLAGGSLSAAVWMKRLLHVLSRDRLVTASVLLCSLSVLSLGLFPVPIVSGIALGILGASIAACNIGMRHIYQELVRDEIKGRFFALVEAISFASFPLAFLWSGAAVARLPVPTVLIISGSGGLVVAGFFRSILHQWNKSSL